MQGNGEVVSEPVIQYLQFMTDKAVTPSAFSSENWSLESGEK